jgi:pteridine reductase
MSSIKEKVILVTGSAVRVGRAICFGLKEAKLILHYNQSEKEAFSLNEELMDEGAQCSLFKADLNNPKEIKALFEFAKKKHAQLDVLINNAATFEKKPFLEVEDFDTSFNVNFKAPLIASQLAAKMMRKNASIINICDLTSKKPLKNYALHGMSKAALLYMSKSLALELSPYIRVNNLLIGAALPSLHHTKEQIKDMLQRHCLMQRKIELEEIVNGVRFLIENEYINGSTLDLDGGWN